jgi:hypothetical protein
VKEGSMFFFEKKNQKTFLPSQRRLPVIPARTQMNEVFLLLFVHKKKTLEENF